MQRNRKNQVLTNILVVGFKFKITKSINNMKKKNIFVRNLTKSIATKLVVPIILLFMIIVMIALTRKVIDAKKSHKKIVTNTVIYYQNQLDKEVEFAAQKALIFSSVNAKLPSVQSAYKFYYTTENIDSANLIIESAILPLVLNVNQITEETSKVHFFLPPAISLYKSWSSEKGDDLSLYRNTILDISKNHKPIKGIEVGKNGFSVHGIAPVFDNNQYLGAVQTSYPYTDVLDNFSKKVSVEYGVYISKEKLKVASNIKNNVGNTIHKDFVIIQSTDEFNLSSLNKDFFNIDDKNKFNTKLEGDNFYALVPILNFEKELIGITVLQVNVSEGVAETKGIIKNNSIFGLFVFVISTILILLLVTKVVIKPIDVLNKNIRSIADGELIDYIDNNRIDEIGKITDVFNSLLKRLKKSTEFADEIGKGNLEVNIEEVNDKDVLSVSLIQMRDNLKEASKIEAERKTEEEKRNWTTLGLAKFADLLRKNSNDISKLADEIIRNLVSYIGANQAGLFIYNDNDSSNATLDLLSVVAYDRKKFLDNSIKLGEGLVGTCAIEKESIYITEIPEDYINITSGLGDATPRSILIVPLKIEDKIFGVVEMASFKKIEAYQIEFIEKLGESIASTLSSVKINQRTSELLEQSQQQSEELAAQEEEMRQNLEEMQATQEEVSRNSQSVEGLIDAIDASVLKVILSNTGELIEINDLFIELFETPRDELLGKNHRVFTKLSEDNEAYKKFWTDLSLGHTIRIIENVELPNGKSFWLQEVYTPIFDLKGAFIKVMNLAFDITEYKISK